MNDYLECWKKYADFNGRARRQEYWMFVLFNVIIIFVLCLIPFIGWFFLGIYALAIFLPSLAVAVRRLHDIGKSGAWYCVAFIPFAGVIWLIVLLATEGEYGSNMYGEDPKALEHGYGAAQYGQNNDNYRQTPPMQNNNSFPQNRVSIPKNYYFCMKCGGKVPNGIEICPKCGNYMPENGRR